MSDQYTYVPPSEATYLKAVLLMLKSEGRAQMADLLRSSECSICVGGSFSRIRWNCYHTTVVFRLPMRDFERAKIGDDDRGTLVRVCNRVMPSDAGLDVMSVDFAPLLNDVEEAMTLEEDLKEIATSLRSVEAEFRLPEDVMAKGREMAEVYLYLYAVENYLRLFIETIGVRSLGTEYFSHFNIPEGIAKSIAARKRQELKNQWLSVRGDSQLFYLDFKELGDLILNNWELFKGYFPGQSWIASKINELGDCRNLVAHNSLVSDHERDVIRVHFRSIVRQLNPFMV